MIASLKENVSCFNQNRKQENVIINGHHLGGMLLLLTLFGFRGM